MAEMLSTDEGIEVVAEAGDGREAVDLRPQAQTQRRRPPRDDGRRTIASFGPFIRRTPGSRRALVYTTWDAAAQAAAQANFVDLRLCSLSADVSPQVRSNFCEYW